MGIGDWELGVRWCVLRCWLDRKWEWKWKWEVRKNIEKPSRSHPSMVCVSSIKGQKERGEVR